MNSNKGSCAIAPVQIQHSAVLVNNKHSICWLGDYINKMLFLTLMAMRMFIIFIVLYLSLLSRQQDLSFVLLTKIFDCPKGVVIDKGTLVSIIFYPFTIFPS